MDKKIKKALAIGIIILALGSIIYYFYDDAQNEIEYKPLTKEQHLILLQYGLETLSNERLPLEQDIDTGVRLGNKVDGKTYGVFESRHFETLDYGKLFVSPIE